MRKSKFLLTILLPLLAILLTNAQTKNPADRYTDAYKEYLDASCPLEKDNIRHFVYFAPDRELIHEHPFLVAQRIEGAQIMYAWRQLEPKRGAYDFSMISEDYNYLLSHRQKTVHPVPGCDFQRFLQASTGLFND